MPAVPGGITVIEKSLVQYAQVNSVISATQFTATRLTEYRDGYFNGWTLYVLRDISTIAGAAAAPQGEHPLITAFIGASGTVTHNAFTAALQVGDELILVHPFLSSAIINGQGGFYYGVVTAVPGANQFTIPGLAGLGAGKFAGATNPFRAFVFRDAAGLSAAPQGEIQAVTAYATATGTFTTNAFTAPVNIGDEMLIVFAPMLGGTTVIAAGNAVGNWQAAETNLVTIGADNVQNRFHALIIDINALIGNISIRVYTQVNGVERRIYPYPAALTWSVAGDAPAIPIINASWPYHEALRITIQSDNAADNGQAVGYDAFYEAM